MAIVEAGVLSRFANGLFKLLSLLALQPAGGGFDGLVFRVEPAAPREGMTRQSIAPFEKLARAKLFDGGFDFGHGGHGGFSAVGNRS